MLVRKKAIEGNGLRWILASGSPRRRELWSLLDWNAEVQPICIDELPKDNEEPFAFVRRMALEKAHAASRKVDGFGVIFAADTIVVDGDRVLGKPLDAGQAREMLWDLRGHVHRVITAIALIDLEQEHVFIGTCETDVPMRSYSHEEIDAYVASGSPLDKAGAYGIQDDGFNPVDESRMAGCFANVMGLPLCHLMRCMREMGIEPPEALPERCQAHTGYICEIFPAILGWEK